MFLATVITYISILFWLFPPFRQIRGGYFLFFLLMGYSDPLALLFRWAFSFNVEYTHLIMSLFYIFSVLYYNKNLNLKWIVTLLILLLFSICLGNQTIRLLTIVSFHILIIFQILIPAVKEFYLKQRINLYLSMILIYELTLILRYIVFVSNYTTGVYYFYLSGIFEIFICLFFIFYNLENSPVIKIPFGVADHE
jgi:hypothetical protein